MDKNIEKKGARTGRSPKAKINLNSLKARPEITKLPAIMACMDSVLENSFPFMTDWLSK